MVRPVCAWLGSRDINSGPTQQVKPSTSAMHYVAVGIAESRDLFKLKTVYYIHVSRVF